MLGPSQAIDLRQHIPRQCDRRLLFHTTSILLHIIGTGGGDFPMNHDSESARDQKTAIAPMLSVRNGARAIEFYKAAFGAGELFRLDDERGAVVARLCVGG